MTKKRRQEYKGREGTRNCREEKQGQRRGDRSIKCEVEADARHNGKEEETGL